MSKTLPKLSNFLYVVIVILCVVTDQLLLQELKFSLLCCQKRGLVQGVQTSPQAGNIVYTYTTQCLFLCYACMTNNRENFITVIDSLERTFHEVVDMCGCTKVTLFEGQALIPPEKMIHAGVQLPTTPAPEENSRRVLRRAVPA